MFADNAVVASLKTGQVYLTGKEAIQNSYTKTTGTGEGKTASVCRLFVPEDHATKTKVSFVVDFHRAGTSPGLGDPTKDIALLYRCENNQITNVWGSVDPNKLASNNVSVKAEMLLQGTAFTWVLPLIRKDMPGFEPVEGKNCHFHDYSNVETWG
jgi:hypothetical protein